MNKTQKRTVVTCVLVALAIGFLYERHALSNQKLALAKLDATLSDVHKSTADLNRARIDLLKSESAVAATQSPKAVESIELPKANPAIMRARPTGTLSSISLRGAAAIPTLPEGFIKGLMVSPSEQTALEAALQNADEQIIEKSIKHSRLEETDDGRAIITIEQYPDGLSVYEELLATFESVLGPERYASFLSHYGSVSFENQYASFGTKARTLSVTKSTEVVSSYKEQPSHITVFDSSGIVATATNDDVTTIAPRGIGRILTGYSGRIASLPAVETPGRGSGRGQ